MLCDKLQQYKDQVLANLRHKTINILCAFIKYDSSLSCYQKFVTRHLQSTDTDKSIAQPTSRYILFDGENISFDASLVTYKNSANIPPIMIINRIYENQNLLSL
jgi:glutamate mutase epsilon subunit